jgi:hypothetical protein
MPNPASPRDPESRQFRPVFIQFEELWFAPDPQTIRVQPYADSPFGRIAAKLSSSVVGRRSFPAHAHSRALGSPRVTFKVFSADTASPTGVVFHGQR